MFDPEQFLESTTMTDANDTKVIPVPINEYLAAISDVKCRSWTKKDDPSIGGLTLDITWQIDDQAVKELLGRDKITVKQGIMLDLTETGGLDMGKGRNVGLGRLREAVELNAPGVPFSFKMLPGRMGRISISHRIVGEDIYAEVKSVAKV